VRLFPMACQPNTIKSLMCGEDPLTVEDLLRATCPWVSFGGVGTSPHAIHIDYTPSLRKRQGEVVAAIVVRERTGVDPAAGFALAGRLRGPTPRPMRSGPFLTKTSNDAISADLLLSVAVAGQCHGPAHILEPARFLRSPALTALADNLAPACWGVHRRTSSVSPARYPVQKADSLRGKQHRLQAPRPTAFQDHSESNFAR
jgi:hypothetical protein